MFGYITTNTPELKVKHLNTYQMFYCGLCKCLKNNHGRLGQASLSYDLTFFVILHTALYEPDTTETEKRCGFHLFAKKKRLINPYSDYASDINILLMYHKLLDDWNDEKIFRKKLFSLFLKGKYKKIQKKYPKKCHILSDVLSKLNEYEEKNEKNLDLVSGLFGQAFGELLAMKEDEWKHVLYEMGFYLGKFIYIMDAWEDLEEDIRNHSYNPLIHMKEMPDFEERCKNILTLMMTECCRNFEALPIIIHLDILRNILYSGVWTRYNEVLNKKGTIHDS